MCANCTCNDGIKGDNGTFYLEQTKTSVQLMFLRKDESKETAECISQTPLEYDCGPLCCPDCGLEWSEHLIGSYGLVFCPET